MNRYQSSSFENHKNQQPFTESQSVQDSVEVTPEVPLNLGIEISDSLYNTGLDSFSNRDEQDLSSGLQELLSFPELLSFDTTWMTSQVSAGSTSYMHAQNGQLTEARKQPDAEEVFAPPLDSSTSMVNYNTIVASPFSSSKANSHGLPISSSETSSRSTTLSPSTSSDRRSDIVQNGTSTPTKALDRNSLTNHITGRHQGPHNTWSAKSKGPANKMALPRLKRPPSSSTRYMTICEFEECAGRTFVNSYNLARHLATQHGDRKPLTCACGRPFKRLDNLSRHLKRYKCDA